MPNLKLSVILPNKNEWGMKLNCWTVGGKSSTLSLKIWNVIADKFGRKWNQKCCWLCALCTCKYCRTVQFIIIYLFVCSFAPIWAIWMFISRKLCRPTYMLHSRQLVWCHVSETWGLIICCIKNNLFWAMGLAWCLCSLLVVPFIELSHYLL